MPSPFPLSSVQQFILECAELASSLDSLDTQEHQDDVRDAVLNGQASCQALLLRRHALTTSADEEAWVDFMIDCLLSRLRFLGRRVGIYAADTRKRPLPHIVPAISC